MQVFEPGDVHEVVVGVDGSPESLEAARFGAAEAAARSLDLVLVHACTPCSARGVSGAAAAAAGRVQGQALVEETLAHVLVTPRTRVSTIVEAASAGELLVGLSGDAALLVLGQHQLDPAGSPFSGRVAPAAVGDARCPVVVVPAGWTRTTAGCVHLAPRPVVVGVGGHGPQGAALEVAFGEAALRRASVLILHASTGGTLSATQRAATEHAVADIVTAQDQDHPDVAVDYRFVPAATVSTWIEASSRASLLVVGGPSNPGAGRSWGRSTSHALLHQSRCPLMVVPASTSPPPDGEWRRSDRHLLVS